MLDFGTLPGRPGRALATPGGPKNQTKIVFLLKKGVPNAIFCQCLRIALCFARFACFSIDFSSIFREKNRKKRAKRLNNGFARKKRRKFTFGTPFFSKKTFWGRFLGSLWVPWGLPGRSGSLPESLKIFINFQLRLKVCPDGPPGSSREAPGNPPGTPRAQF